MTARTFEAPGPGTWELDATHFSKPITRFGEEFFNDSLTRGFKEGTERYGLMLSHLKYSFVHGFPYMKPILAFVPEDAPPGPPPEGFFEQPDLVKRLENGPRAIESKLWREDLKRWDDEIKPDSIERNRKLQDVKPETLSDAELAQHLTDCRDNVSVMFYRHHIFTIPCLIPTGLFLSRACGWTKLPPSDVLGLLKGSSPVSRGIAEQELNDVANALRQAGVTPGQFQGQPPRAVVEALSAMPDPVGPAVQKYFDASGINLTSGYDITERYLLEVPELLVGNIWSALAKRGDTDDSKQYERLKASIRAKVPAEHQAEFDSLLEDARSVNRLRDERGVYNEAPAVGIMRRAVLEAGRRAAAAGRLDDAELLVHAGFEEMLSLLRGDGGPSSADLRERATWYENNTTDDVPPFLGPAPEPPPPPEALPEVARPMAIAVGAVLANVFDAPVADQPTGTVVKGLPVSPGIYEGTARLVRNPDDFKRLEQGDVLVTKNTSATFNVVLPLLGAIVTDRGGQLSHAAIVSREYGLPGIVSTRNATQAIPDGAKVRVDGSAGTVTVVS